jgi:SAM-dependent methyltransferase
MASSLSDIAGTLVRKAWKTIRLRGWWGTLRHGSQKLLRKTKSVATGGIADPVGQQFDAEHGIATAQTSDPGWLGRLTSQNWLHGQAYHPAPLAEVQQALQQLPPELADAVFIDIGSGKGRIVLLASLLSFRKVIGIEYDRVLLDLAMQNLAAFNAPGKDRIELHCIDATAFDFPSEPLVVFFHHPFDQPVFEIVVQRLEAAHRQYGQPIGVIYLDPKCRGAFEASGAFELIGESSGKGVAWVMYRMVSAADG